MKEVGRKKDESILDSLNYATIFTLVTSGLRASELCSLQWKDLDCAEGQWTARFIGKGEKETEQQMYAPADRKQPRALQEPV